ncbi:MAG: hypothetical protein ACM3SW_20415 [Actinomycetota bacterium]
MISRTLLRGLAAMNSPHPLQYDSTSPGYRAFAFLVQRGSKAAIAMLDA